MEATPAPATSPDVRVTQRASYSCAFCTSRKIKCSKTVPCDTCIRRGHPQTCSRKISIVRGRVVNAPASERDTQLSAEQLSLLHLNQLKREVANLRKDKARLELTIREMRSDGTPATSSATPGRASARPEADFLGDIHGQDGLTSMGSDGEEHDSAGRGTRISSPGPDVLEPFATVMGLPQHSAEGLEKGRMSADGAMHAAPAPVIGSALSDMPFRTAADLTNMDLLGVVPSADQSRLIVQAAFQYTAFMWGGVLHAPTWLAEHEAFLQSVASGEGGGRDEAWLSGYFAILSVGLYYAGDMMSSSLGLADDVHILLAEFYFDVCVEALNRSKFMSVSPTFEALQTIVILPVISHNFGASAYVETLIHIGLRIAQILKLHLLGPERIEDGRAAPGLVKRELGRRIWLILRMSETRPDFASPSSLLLAPGRMVEPIHANDVLITDDTVIVQPPSTPTIIAHMICAWRRSHIFRQFIEALAASGTVRDQYAAALTADQALRANIRDFPTLNDPFLAAVQPGEDACDWNRHVRHIWGFIMPSTTILVYRSFLSRAYADKRYEEVRTTCVTAAREILALRKVSVPPMFKRSWFIASYTVLAGVVLATELVHGQPDPSTAAQLRAEIAFLMASLSDCGPSSLVARRGRLLLERVIDPAAAAGPPVQMLDPLMGAAGQGQQQNPLAAFGHLGLAAQQPSVGQVPPLQTGQAPLPPPVPNGPNSVAQNGMAAGFASSGHPSAGAAPVHTEQPFAVPFPPAGALWPGWGVDPNVPGGTGAEDIWANAVLAPDGDVGNLWWPDSLDEGMQP